MGAFINWTPFIWFIIRIINWACLATFIIWPYRIIWWSSFTSLSMTLFSSWIIFKLQLYCLLIWSSFTLSMTLFSSWIIFKLQLYCHGAPSSLLYGISLFQILVS